MGVKKLLERLNASGISCRVRLMVDGGTGSRGSIAYLDDNDEHDEGSAAASTAVDGGRRLRVAVDGSVWVATACHGNGSLLLDDRCLTNYGRASMLREKEQNNGGNTATTATAGGGNGTTSTSNGGSSACNGDDGGGNQDQQRQLNHVEIREEDYVNRCAQNVLDKVLTLRDKYDIDLLLVLDGETPPAKKAECTYRRKRRDTAEQIKGDDGADAASRIRAARHAGANPALRNRVMALILRMLRGHRVPFLVAPYEADGQLAYLSRRKLVDLIVSDDSDLVGCGARAALFKLDVNTGAGVLIRRRDLGCCCRKSSSTFQLSNFSDAMLAVMCVAAGCDYCDSLPGIGIVTARTVVEEAFRSTSKRHRPTGKESSSSSSLGRVFDGLYARTYGRDMNDDAKDEYERTFLMALLMFLHPVVLDPLTQRCVYAVDPTRHPDPDLIDFQPYADLCQSSRQVEEVVGTILHSRRAIHVGEGWIDPRKNVLYDREATPEDVIRAFDESHRADNADSAGTDGNVPLNEQRPRDATPEDGNNSHIPSRKGEGDSALLNGSIHRTHDDQVVEIDAGDDATNPSAKDPNDGNIRDQHSKASKHMSQSSATTGSSASKISSQLSSQPSTQAHPDELSPELLVASLSPQQDESIAATVNGGQEGGGGGSWAKKMLNRLVGSPRKRKHVEAAAGSVSSGDAPSRETRSTARKRKAAEKSKAASPIIGRFVDL